MEVVANNINEALNWLNKNCPSDQDFQLENENTIIQYDHSLEDSIEWSWEVGKHSISGKNVFKFYC